MTPRIGRFRVETVGHGWHGGQNIIEKYRFSAAKPKSKKKFVFTFIFQYFSIKDRSQCILVHSYITVLEKLKIIFIKFFFYPVSDAILIETVQH